MEERCVYRITGTSPLLMNNPASMKAPQTGVAVKKIPSPEDEAASKVYVNAKGELCVPGDWFRKAIIYACKGKRIGKLGAKGLVQASVWLVPGFEMLPLTNGKGKPIKDYKINIQRAVIQKAGVRRARPEIFPWQTEVAVTIDCDFVMPSMVDDLAIVAGKISGWGDHRPSCGGPWGRFKAERISK